MSRRIARRNVRRDVEALTRLVVRDGCHPGRPGHLAGRMRYVPTQSHPSRCNTVLRNVATGSLTQVRAYRIRPFGPRPVLPAHTTTLCQGKSPASFSHFDGTHRARIPVSACTKLSGGEPAPALPSTFPALYGICDPCFTTTLAIMKTYRERIDTHENLRYTCSLPLG